jgi:hypothetical protein
MMTNQRLRRNPTIEIRRSDAVLQHVHRMFAAGLPTSILLANDNARRHIATKMRRSLDHRAVHAKRRCACVHRRDPEDAHSAGTQHFVMFVDHLFVFCFKIQ